MANEEEIEILREIRDLMNEQIALERGEMQRVADFREDVAKAQKQHTVVRNVTLFILGIVILICLSMMAYSRDWLNF